MKRIAIALAAATLGTGCIVTTDGTTSCAPTTLTVDWTFTNAAGVTQTCAQMGIASVDLFYDGYSAGTFPCSNGYQILTNPVPGSHAIVVEGLDSGGAIIARDSYYATVNACGDSFTSANATEGFVRIDYTIAPVNQCGGGYMWFAIHDDVANVTAAVIDQTSLASDKTLYACGSTTILFPLATGSYSLRWIQEVGTPTTTPVALHEYCTPTPFSIAGPGTQPVAVTLGTGVTGCPQP